MKTKAMVAGGAAKGVRATLIAAAATGAVLVLAAPASAGWGTSIPGGYGNARTIGVQEDYFQACDTAANNIGVYGRFILANSAGTVDVSDGNGSAAGCGEQDWTQTPYWATRLQAIQRDGIASPWKNTDGPSGV
ncbi:hypothetical protein [Catellatospora vulcania]|uniref:hypothetical protein n=1 Tax=Catellatospora vulcania TaxID=1460450 RepID=UPI0012D40737|nr:hypothetical protein [Catellatospora vulcania]